MENVTYGRGKQQPEEGGREVEVTLGFRWNWRKTGADACIYVYSLTCGSSYGPHMDTSAPMLSLQIWWHQKAEMEKCWNSAVYLPLMACKHVTCQLTPDRTFGAGSIACIRLCRQAERQILSVKTPTLVHRSLLAFEYLCGSRAKMQMAVNHRTGVSGYSQTDAAVQNTANW